VFPREFLGVDKCLGTVDLGFFINADTLQFQMGDQHVARQESIGLEKFLFCTLAL
jgi:hypothetical protein